MELATFAPNDSSLKANQLAQRAVAALKREAEFTPKPGLVDGRGNGAHEDMDLELLMKSADSLYSTFLEIAQVSHQHPINQELREKIAMIGRQGEAKMLTATNGVNTHKGAIWIIGLLVSVIASNGNRENPMVSLSLAGELASYPDRYQPMKKIISNGEKVSAEYGVMGALMEAQQGFPHMKKGLAYALRHKNADRLDEIEKLTVFLLVVSVVEDTCILHRGTWQDLIKIQDLAKQALQAPLPNLPFIQLDTYCRKHRLSPGGSADLFAAILFLVEGT